MTLLIFNYKAKRSLKNTFNDKKTNKLCSTMLEKTLKYLTILFLLKNDMK